jgi:hypothetical protein
VPFAFLIKPQEDVMLNGQTFSSRTGKTSGLPKLNYLKSHGWKRNLPLEKKKEILWYYNRSDPYVETIVEVAQKIRH